VESRSTRHCVHLMTYCVSPGCLWQWRNRWNDWQRKPKYSEKTCPSAALSTTNPTWCLDANPGCSGGKPASNRWATARLKMGISFVNERNNSITHIILTTCFIYCNVLYFRITIEIISNHIPLLLLLLSLLLEKQNIIDDISTKAKFMQQTQTKRLSS
jgi:hypothetical protein